MQPSVGEVLSTVPPRLRLPLAFLSSYLFFLTRRPISKSNAHYLDRRVSALKSLGELLVNLEHPALREVVRELGRLSSVNFHRVAPQLHARLLPLRRDEDELPATHVFSNTSPPQPVFPSGARVLLVMAPAIGIGDEIMFFRAPSWIKQCCPGSHITVLSAYEQLWDRVHGVDETLYYDDYPVLIRAMRGDEPFEKADTVILADFEKPGLFAAVCDDSAITRYVEISTATHSAVMVDNQNRWLHVAQVPAPYFANYYFSLGRLFAWLGVPSRPTEFYDAMHHTPSRAADVLTIFVSPFTSKYDPSQLFWSHLLGTLGDQDFGRPVKFLLDTGANFATERFAHALRRSVLARTLEAVEIELSHSEGARILRLPDVFRELEKSDVVICADSFAAHAAPLMGCTTLVIAAQNLANWRVPHASSFYFSAEAPVDETGAGMGQILRHVGASGASVGYSDDFVRQAKELAHATHVLQKQTANGHDARGDVVHTTYNEFLSAYESFTADLNLWPSPVRAVASDRVYSQLSPPLNAESFHDPQRLPDAMVYIQDQLNRWNNSNVRKFVALVLEGCESATERGAMR